MRQRLKEKRVRNKRTEARMPTTAARKGRLAEEEKRRRMATGWSQQQHSTLRWTSDRPSTAGASTLQPPLRSLWGALEAHRTNCVAATIAERKEARRRATVVAEMKAQQLLSSSPVDLVAALVGLARSPPMPHHTPLALAHSLCLDRTAQSVALLWSLLRPPQSLRHRR